MRTYLILLPTICLILQACDANTETEAQIEPYIIAENPVEAGRYLITVAGCNDCHTPDFMMNGGTTPENEWLTGTSIGWRGPWGTTYPGNLRIRVQELTEDQWIEMLHTRKTLPPMVWPSVNNMSEQDLKSMYAYIKFLGPKGERAPVAVGPAEVPNTPYLSLFPQNLTETTAEADRPEN